MKSFQPDPASAGNVRIFMEILLLVTALPFLLRLLSVPRLLKLLTPRGLRTRKNLERPAEKTVKLVDRLLHRTLWMHRGNLCLKRTLVLYCLLNRQGMHVHWCLGVKRHGKLSWSEKTAALEGHAWLLYDGRPYLEKSIEELKAYRMIFCFPGNGKHSMETSSWIP